MKQEKSFFAAVCALAVPVALQSMLQSSFGIVDQIMIGQLGSVSIAGVGYAGKFTNIFSFMVSAIGAVAGIMISQYLGQRNQGEVRRSFFLNLWFAGALAGVFTAVCLLFPRQLMGLYTQDLAAVLAAADYLSIIALTYFPMAGATMLAALLRCLEKAALPLYASIAAALLNTGLNYILIFGKWGAPALGAAGAAIATVASQYVNFLVMLFMLLRQRRSLERGQGRLGSFHWGQYAKMLVPVLTCEFLWSVGENVYAAIYGHIGTEASAAMTLINPVQGLMTGALCGLSQAAGVLIGKRLGNGETENAYAESKKLVWYGLVASVCLSIVIFFARGYYVEIYEVEEEVKRLTTEILFSYALIAPFKVLNMIMSGGVLRSGGKTDIVMVIDIIGTWGFGVPLGFLAAFVLNLSIPYVYFILSLEECVRFAISLVVFRRKRWMQSLQA